MASVFVYILSIHLTYTHTHTPQPSSAQAGAGAASGASITLIQPASFRKAGSFDSSGLVTAPPSSTTTAGKEGERVKGVGERDVSDELGWNGCD